LKALSGIVLAGAVLSPLACSSALDYSIDDTSEQGLRVGECIEEAVKPGSGGTGASCSDKGLELDKDVTSPSGEVKHRCCKPAPRPLPGPVPGRCFGDSLGGPTSCKPVETWKLYATAICEKLGAKLTVQDFAEPCGGPTPVPPQTSGGTTKPGEPVPPVPAGSFRYTKFVCCTDAGCTPVPEPVKGAPEPGGTGGGSTDPQKPAPSPGPVCPPPPPPPKCFGGGVAIASPGPGGTGPTCMSADDLKKLAVNACESSGAELTSLKLGGACAGGGYSSATWECCYGPNPPPPPPPPPPPVCFGGVIGDGTQCLADTDIKKLAWSKCEASKASLTRLDFGRVCGIVAGSHLEAKFECCTGPTPVPPPEPGK
jgi:hypothetical protein